MSCSGQAGCLCGACAGTHVLTPQPESNPPGLPAVARRVGTWAQFKESMLARLSSTDYPALHPLTTRSDDDFTVALIDAASVMLDILTFYQERLSNEFYLRTAQQPRSLTELSRLIGYQPSPGVGASAYLAFTLIQATGKPADPNAPAVTIPKGTQVQSVPAQGAMPQTFETAADIAAKAAWTKLAVQTGSTWVPPGGSGLYLQGTSTQLQLGDSLLILGVKREQWDPSSPNPSEQWDVVVLNQVTVDTARQLTYVAWDQRFSHGSGASGTSDDPSTWTTARVFAFRQKAALFGYNAPDPRLFSYHGSTTRTSLPNLIDTTGKPWSWLNYYIGGNRTSVQPSQQVDLDAVYPKVTVGSWFALTLTGLAQLYRVKQASPVSLSYYGISGQVTELAADYVDPSITAFPIQGTQVWAQSEELVVPEQPLTVPLYGTQVGLGTLRNDLSSVPWIAVSGNRQKLAFAPEPGASPVVFTPDDGTPARNILAGEVFALTSAVNLPLGTQGSFPDWTSSTDARTLFVEDENGRTGTLLAALASFTLAPSAATDPVVSECAPVSQVSNAVDLAHTRLILKAALAYCYDRATATVNANVGLATQGSSVTEILGSGSAATPGQEFTLKQGPLTFIQSPTPTGWASTLQVRANGMDWTQLPSLYGAAPTAQVYAALNQADGTTDVLFGDGTEGATLPTGQNNIIADYRIGSGQAGNVGPGSLSTLMDRPLGVSGVTNPSAATGGQDPQTPAGVRQNAPQTVLTLGRAVSITDYQNLAATFAGISMAQAVWIPSGPGRGVFLTVAGTGGSAIPPGNPTNANLVAALQNYGNPLIPFTVQTYVETLFSLAADLQYDPAYDPVAVKAQVASTLSSTFCFGVRGFGQGVSIDEIAAVIQAVPGIVAVNVTGLSRGASSVAGDISTGGVPTVSAWNAWQGSPPSQPLVPPSSDTATRLCACLPVATWAGLPAPAEILVLDPRPTGAVLGVMT